MYYKSKFIKNMTNFLIKSIRFKLNPSYRMIFYIHDIRIIQFYLTFLPANVRGAG